MKEAFEKIIERLREENDFFGGKPMGTLQKTYYCNGVERAIEIVNQIAEEYKDRDCSKCSRRSWYQIGYADAEKKLAEEYGKDTKVPSTEN